MPLRIKGKVVEVKLYPGEPWAFITDPSGPVIRDARRRMERVKLDAKRRVRKRTGALALSIRNQSGFRKRSVYVDTVAGQPRMRYTLIEHDGSPPHIIRARRRKALRFVAPQGVIFAKSVRHPGTRGTKFLTNALPLAGR